MTPEDDTGEISVRVVLLRRDPSGAVLPMCGGMSDDLLESSAVLVAPVNVPGEVVRALLRTAVPVAFAGNPWLNQHRELVFTDGRCQLGGHELRYHEKFGVYAGEDT
jgi:hypothetical protein